MAQSLPSVAFTPVAGEGGTLSADWVLESEQTNNEDAMSNADVFMAKRVNRCVTVTCGARGQTVGATGSVSFRTPKYSTIHGIVDLMKRSVAMSCTMFNTQMKLCETSIYGDRKR